MNISTDQTILKSIQGEESFDYTVDAAATVTLIFLVLSPPAKTKANISIHLNARGAQVNIIGIVLGKDSSSFALHTLQHHAAPETSSNLLVKGALWGDAAFFYDGAIRVEKEAQKTDAYQRNENLLLSKAAFAESKPALEILANDVRCTHGATISSLPKDQLWYLASRGIRNEEANRLLIKGFFASSLSTITDIELKKNIIDSIVNVL